VKKRKLLFLVTALLFAVGCIGIIINSNKKTYSLDELVKESDYTVIAMRNVSICENMGFAYAMNAYEGKKPYKQNGKVYTEMYLCCNCENTIGKKIIVVTDGYYFKEDDYCFLFLKCIDNENNLYKPVNGKTGIIKLKHGFSPMDASLKKELKNEFTDTEDFIIWFTDICNEKADILV